MGATIIGIGLGGALSMGLSRIFTPDEAVCTVSIFLVLVGIIFSLAGAGFVQNVCREKKWVGQAAFLLCFVASASLIIVGLRNIFGYPWAGVFLILAGFASSIAAALAMK